jgi:putative ABC transport system permease protein
MKLIPILNTSLRSIWANRIRSVLTTLGIVIGISAVIAMLSIGEGARQQILDQIQGLGASTITIVPGKGLIGPGNRSNIEAVLNNRIDREFVRKLANPVKYREIVGISPIVSKGYEVSYRSNAKTYSVYGASADYFDIYEIGFQSGHAFSDADDQKLRKVAIVGSQVKEELFGENDALDQSIRVDGSNYRVIGIAADKNADLDQRVVIPLNTAGTVLLGEKTYSQVLVKVSDEKLVDSTASKIESDLLEYYRITDPDKANFSVITSAEILSLVGDITGIFTTLLASIAGISLLVGGIGIMNIMLVSVTERTKEIGLRKALGAKEGAILTQFLVEAMLLTLIGGIIGVALGFLFAFVISKVGNTPVIFSANSVILATSVSTVIGLTFGFYPAYRAAKLNPIDALRYE